MDLAVSAFVDLVVVSAADPFVAFAALAVSLNFVDLEQVVLFVVSVVAPSFSAFPAVDPAVVSFSVVPVAVVDCH